MLTWRLWIAAHETLEEGGWAGQRDEVNLEIRRCLACYNSKQGCDMKRPIFADGDAVCASGSPLDNMVMFHAPLCMRLHVIKVWIHPDERFVC